MLDTNTFSHTGINGTSSGQRMVNAGYEFTGSWSRGENIAYRGTTGSVNKISFIESSHASLFQSSGHRKNLLKESFREVGIATTEGPFTSSNGTTFNTVMITQNFAKSGSDIFLTGVAYDDSVLEDDFYTVGEGLSGINIIAVNTSTGNSFDTTTMTAGGYQIALPSGTYDVTFSDSGQVLGSTTQVTIGSENIKLDLNTDNLLKYIYGTTANDTLNGTNGTDRIDGKGGHDVISGGDNNDILIGSYGMDTINGNAGDDSLYGGSHDDSMEGGSGDDLLNGKAGNDTLNGGSGKDRLEGRLGNDLLNGNDGDDILIGSHGLDTLSGGSGNDTIYGNNDDDLINGGLGIDSLVGGGGNDTLNGGNNSDRLDGNTGNDLLNGDGGNDILIGSTGEDTMYGGADNDSLYGGNDDDLLFGGMGDDALTGGSGSDIFALESGQGTDNIRDFVDGTDLLGLSGALTYSDLDIVNNASSTGVIVYDLSDNNSVLANISNVDAMDFNASDFTTI